MPESVWSTMARWSPVGDEIVFDSLQGPAGLHNLFVVAPDGTGRAFVPNVPTGACCATWSPDGRQLLFAVGGDIRILYIANLDGTRTEPITQDSQESFWRAGSLEPAGDAPDDFEWIATPPVEKPVDRVLQRLPRGEGQERRHDGGPCCGRRRAFATSQPGQRGRQN